MGAGAYTETAAINVNNQVTQTVHSTAGTTAYGYDGAGNRTSKTLGAQTDTYAYDAEHRLTGATVGGVPTTMAYDALGRRVTYASGGATAHYAYDLTGNPLVELDAAGAVQAVYVLEPAQVDQTLPDAQVWDPVRGELVQREQPSLPGFDRPVLQVRGGAAYYYHADHLDSVWAITDATQAVARSYAYGAWGEMQANTGTLPNLYSYTGRQWDSALELYTSAPATTPQPLAASSSAIPLASRPVRTSICSPTETRFALSILSVYRCRTLHVR